MKRLASLLSVLALLLPASALAQSGVGKSLVVAGLTTTNGPDTYAWIALQPTSPSLIAGKQIAVYRKNGPAASANNYSRVAIIEAEADVRTVGSLLVRAGKLGENIGELDSVLSELLESASAASGITTAQKMSTFISGAWGHDDKMKRVLLLARQRPSVALCAGLAHAEKIPGGSVFTYELRDYDRTANADLGVLGRVTLDAASPMVLPAPGRPIELPDTSAKGNLNATLRWATPNALRDLAPLHYGFDVYRVTKAAALSHGWNATPPTNVAAFAAEPQARKINTLAILTPVLLTAAEAADLSNTTVYVDDDNGRFKTGGSPFNDGNEFYYFAVARDLLGKGGTPSQGTLVQLCDRLPPGSPRKVTVRNLASYNGVSHDQRFKISWEPPALEAGESISAYYVYRWRTPHEIAGKSVHLDPVEGKPDKNLIAILPGTQTSFVDNGATTPPTWAELDYGVPTWPTDNGKTYFYTIRAADNSVCANVSGNSSPVWGVLRDREGPQGATGDLLLKCFQPNVTFTSATQTTQNGLTADQGHLLFDCTSLLAKGLAWAEFKYKPNAATDVPMGRANFSRNASAQLEAMLRKTLPGYSGSGTFYCRVASTGGVISPWVPAGTGDQGGGLFPQPDKYLWIKWNAVLNPTAMAGAGCGWRNQAVDPVTGATTDITGSFIPTTGSREWKIYRRVNDSVQTLIAQGEIAAGSTAAVVWTDADPPASNCTICYYLQLFDEHGNPSPLVQQGECVEHFSDIYLPTPMLQPITSVAPFISGKMKVSWFCSTAGVDRFEVWVGRKSGETPSSSGSGLSTDLATHPNTLTGITDAEGVDFSVFQTAVARHLSITGTPEFSAELPVSTSDTYVVLVRAVGPGTFGARTMGSYSNVETFQYSLRGVSMPVQVPWPDRPLPPQADFHDGITATYLNVSKIAPWKGNAVRIGEYADPTRTAAQTVNLGEQQGGNTSAVRATFNLSTFRDAERYLYTNDTVAAAEPSETIPGCVLPIALYRVQVANTNFPTVPGDVVQVSPLMEHIAQVKDTFSGSTVVTDAFISVLHNTDCPIAATQSNFTHQIYLMDRQPVLKGATYKYLLVRFSPTREIERVIVTNTVDVP